MKRVEKGKSSPPIVRLGGVRRWTLLEHGGISSVTQGMHVNRGRGPVFVLGPFFSIVGFMLRRSQAFEGFRRFLRYSQVFAGFRHVRLPGFRGFRKVFAGFHKFSQVFACFLQLLLTLCRCLKTLSRINKEMVWEASPCFCNSY